ncbi:MAG: hypothetical protein WC155_03605 [Candidatus Cloacimonadales bacterium]
MLILNVYSVIFIAIKQLIEHGHCEIGYEPGTELMSELFYF